MDAVWKVEKIPVLTDNFVFVLHRQGRAWVVDPGEAAPVLDFLQTQDLSCEGILVTHHHNDHIAGIPALVEKFACPVYAPAKNLSQIPGVTRALQEGDVVLLDDLKLEVWELPGHTLGHTVFWVPSKKWLFSGDVLFALGCGRLFEGTFEQMFASLTRIRQLPDETLIFCTHDYFPTNQRFCESEGLSLEDYESIHPLLLWQEKKFNPFLRASSVEEFARLRQRRNGF